MSNKWTDAETQLLGKLLEEGHVLSREQDFFFQTFVGKSYDAIAKKIKRSFHKLAVSKEKELLAKETSELPDQVPDSSVIQAVEADVATTRSRAEFNLLKRKYEELRKQEAQHQSWSDLFREIVAGFPPVPIPKPFVFTEKEQRNQMTMTMEISDLHWGDRVNPDTILSLGEYDRALGRGRMAYYVQEALKLKRNMYGYKINKINVHILGDIVSGMIHPELIQGGDGKVVHWVVDAALCLSGVIRDLASEFSEVHVYGVSGNHSRFNKIPNTKEDAYNNFDYIVYEFMSTLLANQPNVHLHFPQSFFVLADVNNFKSLLIHGHMIKSYNGIPAYGILRAASNLSELINLQFLDRDWPNMGLDEIKAMLAESFKYIEMGHFHTISVFNKSVIEIFVNGSVVGNSEYNITVLGVGQKPKQWVLFAHPEHGYIGRHVIDLSLATREMGERYTGEDSKLLGENWIEISRKIKENKIV